MVRGRARTRDDGGEAWPGFVDVLTTLLLAIIFLLFYFVITQWFLSQQVSSKDQQIASLNAQLAELASQLDLAMSDKADLQAKILGLEATLQSLQERAGAAEGEVGRLTSELATKDTQLTESNDQLALLNAQISALREQLLSLQQALEAADAKDKEQKAVIADLGRKLNTALAQKVQELAKYRSEFFGRLREVLGDRQDIQIVGDRFVFQSEVLFETGSAVINEAGQAQLAKLAQALVDISQKIPKDLEWILRVDGHSDRRPIATIEYPSNLHLSAARAIAVVNFLISQGVPASRLAAAGFADLHPLDPADTEDAYRKNRRIEFKLTER
jgi:chemotaxis protein MotB